MNNTINRVNPEQVLFFDIETVRRSKVLNENSREFDLFRRKTRNRDTDEYLPDADVITEYSKRAALKPCYTRVVTIGVGFIKGGKLYIKALHGSESKILKDFFAIASKFEYVCGANVIGYDLPVVVTNGYRYCKVTDLFPDRFITSGKKPWNLDKVIDLMEIFRGTHYTNSSLDEMCYHFGIKSSKDGLDGSMVSDEYWNNGVKNILEYVKRDVLASTNLFLGMRFEERFQDFIDKTDPVEPVEFELLTAIHKSKILTQEQAMAIDEFCQELSGDEVNNVKLILEAALVNKKGVLAPEHQDFLEKL